MSGKPVNVEHWKDVCVKIVKMSMVKKLEMKDTSRNPAILELEHVYVKIVKIPIANRLEMFVISRIPLV